MKSVSSIFLPLMIAAAAVGCVASCETGPDLSNINKATASNSKTTPAEQELSGVYSVSGVNENSGSPYEGTLTIANQDEAYRFSWQTTKAKYSGVGVQMGDAVAATYAESSAGKGCGVVLYTISPDGTMDGRIAKWGEYKFTSEKAVRVEGTGFEGKYNVKGTNGLGKPYDGTINIERNGMGYQVTWRTSPDYVGFGIWRGDRAAIGFGGQQCSFALYQVMPNGKLEGRWGSQRTVAFGIENAKRQ
jgi:hypothetical protein